MPRPLRWPVLAVLLLPVVALAAPRAPADRAQPSAGERIYREGRLPSGKAVHGEREGGASVTGQDAACTTCHRRSGLGSYEGQSVIPPIIGRYLFRTGQRNLTDLDLPHVQGYTPGIGSYTDSSLARAIRDGKDRSGRPLSYLMPRYKLDDAAMASVIAYLKGLTSAPVPGTDHDTLHFATIITPDADPVARRGMLAVLEQFFADKNRGYRGESPAMQSSRGMMYRVNRKWRLHVWELSGPPETWEEQLRQKLAQTPVFAVVSGLGRRTWAPVHRFCEEQQLPCLFPNVDLPVVAEQDFYSLYFDRGVLVEAGLIETRLSQGQSRLAARRLVQVFRSADIGADAAKALEAAVGGGLAVVSRPLEAGPAAPLLAKALADVGPEDAVVLWLRTEDLAALPGAPRAAAVFVSGLMGGLQDAPLAAAWREAARITFPFDLPEARRVRMNFPLNWLRVKNVPLIDERVQTGTWLACGILSETVSHMLDSFVRDYLVERIEGMLSHRLLNGYYPRLGLAPGQRFASKGGYLARFAPERGGALVADGGWTVP